MGGWGRGGVLGVEGLTALGNTEKSIRKRMQTPLGSGQATQEVKMVVGPPEKEVSAASENTLVLCQVAGLRLKLVSGPSPQGSLSLWRFIPWRDG